MVKDKELVVGISLGDVNGIGPEVAIAAANDPSFPVTVKRVLIGSHAIVNAVAGCIIPAYQPGAAVPISCWEPEGGADEALTLHPGVITEGAARASVHWIESGVARCLTGDFDALVTAPICKEGWHRAGVTFPGHTEMLAELTHTRSVVMVLAGKGLQVALVTRHIPLKDVAEHLTQAAIEETVLMVAEIADARPIAVCGLNPHAGDGGLLGDEEIRIILPAIEACRARGLNVLGPVPADTVFHQAVQGKYSVVVAMYHDQGLGPLKMHAFDEGVNITLGLPIIRTSPDHGTAFDIAGQGKANPSSMVCAIQKAIELVRQRR